MTQLTRKTKKLDPKILAVQQKLIFDTSKLLQTPLNMQNTH